MKSFRIGQGFDVHRFADGCPLKICGVTLSADSGLEGHSDADVGLHAVADAIFGALARGDLGEHFPESDPRWRDADSSVFVARAVALAVSEGFALANCDLTIVGDRPRIAPHRDHLRESLARILGVSARAVSVKATTTEGLGFLGREEGLGAIAIVLLSEVDRNG
ncbi:MAG: 2-C-methyl-D-erythritol 2,4-cyclodiphosphate synthase [Acidobacteria bacterium]|nr:2-C-methyl-D-erythritol 2,4-cyclodiphosphate synthase [Acidobacteriota bacterium]